MLQRLYDRIVPNSALRLEINDCEHWVQILCSSESVTGSFSLGCADVFDRFFAGG